MVNLIFRHESHLTGGNTVIKSPSATPIKPMPPPVCVPSHTQTKNRPVSPLTQNEPSMLGAIPRGRRVAQQNTHSVKSNEERQDLSSRHSDKEMVCDYDRSVIELYEMLESSQWENACDRCRTHPEEAHTWVTRRDANGNIRWKLLPIHAAVIFQAPLPVIEGLLSEHPIAAGKRDDQGMLPLHLAFRHKSDESIIEKLLHQYPGGVIITDQRERFPIDHAKNSQFSTKMMDLYAETYAKCNHETGAVTNEAEIKATYENRMTALTDAYEARIDALIRTHEVTIENSKMKEEEELEKNKMQHKLEMDELRELLSRQESSGKRVHELEAELQELRGSLTDANSDMAGLRRAVQDQKNQKVNLIAEMREILRDQKDLRDRCDKQNEQLDQAQKLREQLLRTLLQKDDGKTIQMSTEICQLSCNAIARTEKLLTDAARDCTEQQIMEASLPKSGGNTPIVVNGDCIENSSSHNPGTATDWSPEHNDAHGDDISAITESSYLQPFGDR